MATTLNPGDKVWFDSMRMAFTVRCSNERFAICTRPFALKKTVLYCIVDLVEKVRGPEDLVFGFGAETDQQCQEMLERVTKGESKVSYRRVLPLVIQRILPKPLG